MHEGQKNRDKEEIAIISNLARERWASASKVSTNLIGPFLRIGMGRGMHHRKSIQSRQLIPLRYVCSRFLCSFHIVYRSSAQLAHTKARWKRAALQPLCGHASKNDIESFPNFLSSNTVPEA